MTNREDKFIQPVISVIGLGVSMISLLLPLFTKTGFTQLFINKSLTLPISFVVFILGFIIIWQVTESSAYIDISIGKRKDRGRGFNEPLIKIGARGVVWVIFTLNIIEAISFISIYVYFHDLLSTAKKNEIPSTTFIGLIQGFIYLLFFLGLIAMFSILLKQTLQKFKWSEDQENLLLTITGTLENNGIINSGIQIQENRQLNLEESRELGIEPLARKIKIKTNTQQEQMIECIMSNDGKKFIKLM